MSSPAASDLWTIGVLALGVGACALVDLRTRRVPNTLTLGLALVGVASAAAGASRLSLEGALVGLVLGLAVMLPGYLLGGLGAGDVKLFGAVGALLGPADILPAFLYTAMCGGVLALVVAQRRRRLTLTVSRTARLIATGARTAADIEHPQADNRFAYVPAIAVGSLLAALGP
jgi:prepilin peptidase CpaA